VRSDAFGPWFNTIDAAVPPAFTAERSLIALCEGARWRTTASPEHSLRDVTARGKSKLDHSSNAPYDIKTGLVTGNALAVRGAIGLISARPWVWFDGEAGAESGGRESST
jgi:hypothetical protein